MMTFTVVKRVMEFCKYCGSASVDQITCIQCGSTAIDEVEPKMSDENRRCSKCGEVWNSDIRAAYHGPFINGVQFASWTDLDEEMYEQWRRS